MKTKLPLALTALLLTSFLTACASSEVQAERVAEIRGVAQASTAWPDLPADCRVTLSDKGRAQSGQRLDSAYLRVSGLLSAQDARVLRCAQWYDGQRSERAQ